MLPILGEYRAAGSVRTLGGGVLLAAHLVLTSAANAQLNSLTTPVDGRTIALGESFTGTRGDLGTMFYNPAGIAGIEGAQATYSYRHMDWISYLEDFNYFSVQAALQTPFAVFGAFYNRQSYGNLAITGPTAPEPIGTLSPYDHTIGLTGAVTIVPGLDVGASVKGFQYVDLPVGLEADAMVTTGTSSWAIMFDLGALYTISLTTGSVHHDIGIGSSLQNFGSNVVIEQGSSSISDQPARYVRVGLSYSASLDPLTEGGLTPCRLTATGEYRNILNSQYFANEERDYYGWGVELWGFEVLALRAGWFLSNINWIYGNAGEPMFRYGVGVHFPLYRLGLSVPLAIRGDYAVITLRDEYGWLGDTRTSLSAFTVGVSYEGNLFK
jgi:hypothetical protein